MSTCRAEMIFIPNLRDTFCAKHDFTVTKLRHAIKLLCKNVIKTLYSKDFFLILVTKDFSILKHFSRFWNFWNIFLNCNFFFSILKYFSQFYIFVLDSVTFLLDFINIFLTLKYFSGFQNFFSVVKVLYLDYETFFSILKVFSRWRLSVTIA